MGLRFPCANLDCCHKKVVRYRNAKAKGPTFSSMRAIRQVRGPNLEALLELPRRRLGVSLVRSFHTHFKSRSGIVAKVSISDTRIREADTRGVSSALAKRGPVSSQSGTSRPRLWAYEGTQSAIMPQLCAPLCLCRFCVLARWDVQPARIGSRRYVLPRRVTSCSARRSARFGLAAPATLYQQRLGPPNKHRSASSVPRRCAIHSASSTRELHGVSS